MFLSLKGSLNTKFPRFKGILDIYAGAAAAYSLRRLSKVASSVVRVRRASDNSEKDFSAADISSGTLVPWVNEALNIKTYDFSTGNGGLGFQSNLTLEGGESAAGVDDALKMSVVSTGSPAVHRCYQNLSPLGGGSSLRVTFKAYRPSSNVNSGKLGFSFASGFLSANVSPQFFSADDAWEEFTFDGFSGSTARFYLQLSATNGAGSLKSVFNGTTGDHIFIKDLSIDVVSSTGTVSEWYDQSGNGNDAVQAVAGSQPKIVDGGSLVADGIDFDGVDDRLFGSHLLNTDDVLYAAVVAKNKNLSKRGLYVNNLFYNSSTDNGGFSVEAKTFNQAGKIAGWMYDTNVSASVQDGLSSLTQDQVQLLSFDLSNGSSKFHLDGSLVNTSSANMNSEDAGSLLNIGNSPSGTAPLEGSIKEIIIYNSDQSANREAIEDNINNQYDIY